MGFAERPISNALETQSRAALGSQRLYANHPRPDHSPAKQRLETNSTSRGYSMLKRNYGVAPFG
jgi:hypothetical protein